MPHAIKYCAAEVFMKYGGMTIYHVYKDNDPDQGCREYWFDTREDSRDDGGFDIREVAEKLGMDTDAMSLGGALSEEVKKSIVRRAIRAKLLGRMGRKSNQ